MICAMYIRVSTDDQIEFSPDAQKRALVEYAKKNGYQFDDRYIFIDEGISGTSAKKRPAFQQMIATAKKKPKPFDAILVHKFDRFARSREDSVVYKSLLRKECGIKVISITEQMEDDKFSVILEAMLEAMAEYYSLNLSDEVMKGMMEKARRGKVQNTKIYGYDIIDNKRVINHDEATVVKEIYKLFLAGESCPKIAKRINALGYKNKIGNTFSSKRIKYILESPIYYGASRWNYAHTEGTRKVINDEKDWVIVENDHPAIIEREMWEQAQEVLKSWHKDVHFVREGSHLFTGIFRCSTCGATLSFKMARFKRKDGGITISDGYQCCRFRNSACTTGNYLNEKKAIVHMTNILKETFTIVNDTWSLEKINVEDTRNNNDAELYNLQLSKLNHKLELAKKAYLNEIDTIDEYKANKASIQKEINEIENLLRNSCSNDKTVEEFQSKLTNVIQIFQDTSIDIMDKNKALKSIIKSIVYDKSKDTMTAYFYL